MTKCTEAGYLMRMLKTAPHRRRHPPELRSLRSPARRQRQLRLHHRLQRRTRTPSRRQDTLGQGQDLPVYAHAQLRLLDLRALHLPAQGHHAKLADGSSVTDGGACVSGLSVQCGAWGGVARGEGCGGGLLLRGCPGFRNTMKCMICKTGETRPGRVPLPWSVRAPWWSLKKYRRMLAVIAASTIWMKPCQCACMPKPMKRHSAMRKWKFCRTRHEEHSWTPTN